MRDGQDLCRDVYVARGAHAFTADRERRAQADGVEA